jgi:hypothetical protein
MTTITCHIPLKLRLRGELSEDEWLALEDKLVTLYVRAIKHSLRELEKSHLIAREKSPEGDLTSTLRLP